MKSLSIQIVPVQHGFLTVIDSEDEKEIFLGEPVIAWRIETFSTKDSDTVFSTCTPITVDGDAVSNCIGVQNPDCTVTIFQQSTFASLSDAQSDKYPK